MANHAGRAMAGKMMGHMHKDKRSEGMCQTEEATVMWLDWGRGCTRDKVGAVVSDTVRL